VEIKLSSETRAKGLNCFAWPEWRIKGRDWESQSPLTQGFSGCVPRTPRQLIKSEKRTRKNVPAALPVRGGRILPKTVGQDYRELTARVCRALLRGGGGKDRRILKSQRGRKGTRGAINRMVRINQTTCIHRSAAIVYRQRGRKWSRGKRGRKTERHRKAEGRKSGRA